jgi:hypothetical protein
MVFDIICISLSCVLLFYLCFLRVGVRFIVHRVGHVSGVFILPSAYKDSFIGYGSTFGLCLMSSGTADRLGLTVSLAAL